jgi:hypothetical protein
LGISAAKRDNGASKETSIVFMEQTGNSRSHPPTTYRYEGSYRVELFKKAVDGVAWHVLLVKNRMRIPVEYTQITISVRKQEVKSSVSYATSSIVRVICEAKLQVLVFLARFPVSSSETIQPAAKRQHLVAPCVSAGRKSVKSFERRRCSTVRHVRSVWQPSGPRRSSRRRSTP